MPRSLRRFHHETQPNYGCVDHLTLLLTHRQRRVMLILHHGIVHLMLLRTEPERP